MIGKKPGGSNRPKSTPRKSKNSFVTKSGQTIKINQSIGDRIKAKRAVYAQKRAERLAGMPKSRVKRFFFRMHPKRLYKYWFSREGGIMALKLFGIGTLAGFLLLVGVFAYFRKDLPNIRDISGGNIGGSILYYDRTGQTLLFEDVDGSKRIQVKDDAISPFIKEATIAIEDKDFFKHGGFDIRGIARAGVNNLVGKSGTTQGGSTISQQLVRLTQTEVGKQQTYVRKIKEIILSVELEREYSKQEILTGYLNTAPYGGIENGVEAASQNYFHKSAKDLTLAESAMLAAIPKSPTYYSPYNKTDFDKDALIGRQHYILDLMEQQRMITSAQRDEAKKVDILAAVQPRPAHYENIKAPWFVLTAKQELERRKGSASVKLGGWKVITTLDLNAQKNAEEQVAKGIKQVRAQRGDTAAFVAEDVKTGQVVALVGGDDFNNTVYGKNNYAHDLELPPGSSFKPYDYTALIDDKTKNAGAGSVIYDINGAIPGYPCTTGIRGNCVHDYDFNFPGPVTLRYALGGSRNVPAIKAMLMVGVDQTIDVAHRLMTNYGDDGKPDPTIGNYKCYYDEKNTQQAPCYASSAIGDGAYLRLDEHVHGYGTLSRNGLNIPQTYIMKVEDSSGKTLLEWKPSKGVQAVNPETAYIIDDMLADPNASYFPNKIHRFKGWKFGLKTGTTNDSKDGLMMMMSTQYAAGVWVGYHNRQVVMSGVMETMTSPIVNGWMQAMHTNLKPEERVKPAGLQTLPAFIVRNKLSKNGEIVPSPTNDLFPSWYKQPSKSGGSNKNIDQVSNKLATECTPQRAIKQSNGADSNTFSVDKFVNGGAASTTEKDDVHKCGDVKPTVTLTNKDFNCPDGGCAISANVTAGTHPLSSDKFPGIVNFLIDGQVVNTQNISSSGTVTFNYTPDFNGTKSLSVEVIDSVLYDGQDSTTMSASGGNSTPALQNLTPGATVLSRGAANFSWTNFGGGVNYILYWNCNGQTGSKSTGTTASYTPNSASEKNALYSGAAYPNVTCTWYVEASNGQSSQSNSATFSLKAP